MSKASNFSRTWTEADKAAGIIPIHALRHAGTIAVRLVELGQELTVTRYGHKVALLVPIPRPTLKC